MCNKGCYRVFILKILSHFLKPYKHDMKKNTEFIVINSLSGIFLHDILDNSYKNSSGTIRPGY